MSNYIVTAIYDNLFGTDLGGRPARGDHYRHSLKSIAKIDNAKFKIFTDDVDGIKNFIDTNISNITYNIYDFDLRTTEFSDKINKIKNIEETKKSVRCIELQYSKLLWLELIAKNIDDNDYIFWFDAGLSYSGLIPEKYLGKNTEGYHSFYYYSNLFNNTLLDNIISFADDSIFCVAKDNLRFFWDNGLPEKWFINHKKIIDYHIIGGLFGGKCKNVKILCEYFRDLANKLLDNENILYSEENILTTIYFNYTYLFKPKFFDIWWHENNISGVMPKEEGLELLKRVRSFYRVLEDFIE
jgi:hypothetical protein